MENIRFSIVVPAYNVERYIAKCLNSILHQSYNNLQIVVVDDGSSDATSVILADIASEHPEICVVSQDNKGAGAARNVGVKYVDGHYFMFVDSDDYILKDCLNKISERLLNKQYDMVSFNLVTEEENGRIKSVQEMNAYFRGEHSAKREKRILCMPTLPVCKMYRTEWYIKNGFRFPEGVLYEDVPLVPYMLAQADSILMLDEAYYVYLQRSSSTMHRKADKRMLDIISAMKYCKKLFLQEGLYEKYCEEIEYVAVCTVFFQVLEMANASNYDNKLQVQLSEFMRAEYPNVLANQYLSLKDKDRVRFLMEKKYRQYFFRYMMKKVIKAKIRLCIPASMYYKLSLKKRYRENIKQKTITNDGE